MLTSLRLKAAAREFQSWGQHRMVDQQFAGRQIADAQRPAGRVVAAQFDFRVHCEARRTQPHDGDIRRVNFDTAGQQLAAGNQLPDVRRNPASGGARQHSLIVLRAQFQAVEVQLRTIPAKRGGNMRESDVISGLPVKPILDLRLILGGAVQDELQAQHQQEQHDDQPREAETQYFAGLG